MVEPEPFVVEGVPVTVFVVTFDGENMLHKMSTDDEYEGVVTVTYDLESAAVWSRAEDARAFLADRLEMSPVEQVRVQRRFWDYKVERAYRFVMEFVGVDPFDVPLGLEVR